jgi:hypothetical protein
MKKILAVAAVSVSLSAQTLVVETGQGSHSFAAADIKEITVAQNTTLVIEQSDAEKKTFALSTVERVSCTRLVVAVDTAGGNRISVSNPSTITFENIPTSSRYPFQYPLPDRQPVGLHVAVNSLPLSPAVLFTLDGRAIEGYRVDRKGRDQSVIVNNRDRLPQAAFLFAPHDGDRAHTRTLIYGGEGRHR